MAAYAIVIEQRGSCFRAYAPDFPGCTATGNSLAEAEAAIRAALQHMNDPAAPGTEWQPIQQGGYLWVHPGVPGPAS